MDSSYYFNFDVSIKEIDTVAGTVHNTFQLQMVNMANEGYSKDTGLFFNDPSYAYKFKAQLTPQYQYRLVVHDNQTGETDSSQTVLLSRDSVGIGAFNVPPLFYNFPSPIYFGSSLQPDPYYAFYVAGNVSYNAVLLQAIMRLHWVDKDMPTNVETDRYYDYYYNNVFPYPVSSSDAGYFSSYFTGYGVIGALQTAMGTTSSNIHRYLDSSDIFLYVGTSDLNRYLIISSHYGYGVQTNSAQPIYSNAYGIWHIHLQGQGI